MPRAAGLARRPRVVLAGLFVIVGIVPLTVAAVSLRTPAWYPSLDWAIIELRVRDVGWSHPPMLGSPGRFQALGELGAHPGPLFFYLLAPFYRLLGATPSALLVSTAAVNL